MLSKQENETLTQVAAGTPMGELLRHYWHPIAATGELLEKPTKSIKIMGEELVLYRTPRGEYGLIGERCPHRRVNLLYGIPEDDGLRCMYHGWKFDQTGRCIEQPFEETINPDARFKERVKIAGYPVQELGGLLFAYFGPQPAPLLPTWGPLVWDNAVRDVALSIIPCNWLQAQENSLDPVHVEWLHVNFGNWWRRRAEEGRYKASTSLDVNRVTRSPMRVGHKKIGFDVFEYGMVKRRVLEGSSEADDDWRVGHPVMFPNMLLVGDAVKCLIEWRVPIDETSMFHITYNVWRAAPGREAPRQDVVPARWTPMQNEDGDYYPDLTLHQDFLAWTTQGPIAQRDKEMLGESDTGVIMFRRLLQQQMKLVQDGGEPMAVFRDRAELARIELPLESGHITDVRQLQYWPNEAGYTPAVAAIEATLATWSTYLEDPQREPVLQH